MDSIEKNIHHVKNIHQSIEIVLVDDGTKDNCGKIADNFANRFSDFIKVIHKENGGLSSARNIGIKNSVGEYIICFDSDDYITDDCFEQILNAIDSYNNPDMIVFDMYIGSTEKGFIRNDVPYLDTGLISRNDFLKELTKNKGINSSVACKLIKRKFFNKVLFNERTKFAEDYEFMTKVSTLMKGIVYIKQPIYYYVMRDNSITHTVSVNQLIDYYNLVKNRYENYSSFSNQMSIYGLVVAALSVLINVYKDNYDVNVNEQEELIRKNIFRLLFSSEYNTNEKKKFVLIYLGLARNYYKSRYHTRCRGCF